jgi:hypothetical protein
MIRTLRLYNLSQIERMSTAKAEERLRAVRLRKLVATASPRQSRVLADLAERLMEERLEGPRSRPGHWDITLRGKWPVRRLTVAPDPPPYVPVEVTIWLRKTSGWLVVFEANRALGDASVYLIAAALAGSAGAVAPMALDKRHWEAIASWLDQRSRRGGNLLGGRFYGAKPRGSDLEWIALRRAPGSDPSLLQESFETAEGIGELLIETPYISSIDANVVCRIGRTANVRVYGTEVSDGVIDALLLELESVWEGIPAVDHD